MRESKNIVEINNIVLEKISNCDRNRKKMKHRFVNIVKCNIDIMTRDIDEWWIDSNATRHIAKTKNHLVDFVELNKGEQIIYMKMVPF